MADFKDLKFKKEKRQFIDNLLKRDDVTGREANMRALLRIFQLQTTSEQLIEYTAEDNGVGFTAFDAEFMTSLAKQFISKKSISERQFTFVKKSMKKYAGQLLKIALEEIRPEDCNIENLIPDTPVESWVRPARN